MLSSRTRGLRLPTRHKSGIALRFPRILALAHRQARGEAGTIQNLEAVLASARSSP